MKHHSVFHSRLGHFIEPQFSKSHLMNIFISGHFKIGWLYSELGQPSISGSQEYG